jgi:hypothetical protein
VADADAGDIGEQILHGGSLLGDLTAAAQPGQPITARSQPPEVAGI